MMYKVKPIKKTVVNNVIDFSAIRMKKLENELEKTPPSLKRVKLVREKERFTAFLFPPKQVFYR